MSCQVATRVQDNAVKSQEGKIMGFQLSLARKQVTLNMEGFEEHQKTRFVTTQFVQAGRLPDETCSLSYHRHHDLCLNLWTGFGFECFGCSKAGLVTTTNTVHNTDWWVLGCLSFLETIGQAIDHIVRISTIKERDRVAFLARLVDNAVKVGDIPVIRPLRRSERRKLTKHEKSLPAHEHIPKVDHICTFRWDNLRSFS